jgi:GT2 family glycosyltransferase
MRMPTRSGSAAARNMGARHATGDILLFLDADVCVQQDTLPLLLDCFAENPEIRAVFGSYDDCPSAPDFHSQFRNLLHCYIHRTSQRHAHTFWTGCGAVYRDVFEQFGGFDESMIGMNDIDFGGRLAQSGLRIDLRPDIQVQHRKRWTFFSWVETDLVLRGIPWTILLLRNRRVPNTLNVSYRYRVSVGLVLLFALTCAAALFYRPAATTAAVTFIAILTLNLRLYSFLRNRRGLAFAVAGAGAHFVHLLVCGLSLICGSCWFALSGERNLGQKPSKTLLEEG